MTMPPRAAKAAAVFLLCGSYGGSATAQTASGGSTQWAPDPRAAEIASAHVVAASMASNVRFMSFSP